MNTQKKPCAYKRFVVRKHRAHPPLGAKDHHNIPQLNVITVIQIVVVSDGLASFFYDRTMAELESPDLYEVMLEFFIDDVRGLLPNRIRSQLDARPDGWREHVLRGQGIPTEDIPVIMQELGAVLNSEPYVDLETTEIVRLIQSKRLPLCLRRRRSRLRKRGVDS